MAEQFVGLGEAGDATKAAKITEKAAELTKDLENADKAVNTTEDAGKIGEAGNFFVKNFAEISK